MSLIVESASLSVADLLADLGAIDPGRVRLNVPLGTATEDDLIRVNGLARGLFELVDGVLVEKGMGFNENQSILLSAPPYYYAVLPVILSSIIGDRYKLRGPVIIFNCICLIVGFCMLGFTDQVTVRYIGTYLATGAYISNWAAITTYQANNITGQWKRAFTAAAVTAMNSASQELRATVFCFCDDQVIRFPEK